MTKLQKQLFEMQDPAYKEFHRKLIPTVDPETIIGVRTPLLRQFAKQFYKTDEAAHFLEELPHRYYEENNLHGFLIEEMKDYDRAMEALERFLPYVDNWATCDLPSPKVLKKHPAEVYEKAKVWMKSDHVYTVRYGIGVLMSNYLDEYFKPEMPSLVAQVHSEEYYINMMCAWYMATALAKQYDTVIPYLTEHKLGVWVHNKSIQKAVESRRISEETKLYLRTLRRKN